MQPVGSINSFQVTQLDAAADANTKQGQGVDHQLEKLLWTEMLKSAGIEDAIIPEGAASASSFAQFVIEEMAADLAEQHPFGVGEAANDKVVQEQ
ncbi:MAG: hypothetical protein AAF950_14495 [Pseudomonadota bacterium]